MSRVLFLDMDGVLNSVRFFNAPSKNAYRRAKRQGKQDRPQDAIDPTAVERLNAVVERTGCKVVISSTWRTVYSAAAIEGFLQARGFRGEVIGATPQLPPGGASWERGHEIQAWMDPDPNGDAPTVEAFAIVDDFSDMAHLKHRLVQTDTTYGLQGEHVERLVELLNGAA